MYTHMYRDLMKLNGISLGFVTISWDLIGFNLV